MNRRIRQVREESGLNRVKFSDKIGISESACRKLESGENNPSEQTVRAICSVFKVRRQWLEEGAEPMRLPDDEDDEIVDSVLAGEDEFVKALIRAIAKTPGGWEKMREVFTAVQAELDKIKKADS